MSVTADILLPQRPQRPMRQVAGSSDLLEPEWVGRRLLVRIGLGDPRFVGYAGPVELPAEVYEHIAAATRAGSAVLDGVLVSDWRDEVDLEPESDGARAPAEARTVFAAFDVLAIDGTSLLEVPLLERKRQLTGLVVPSASVRLTPFVLRGQLSWGDSLREQGFRQGVLKDLNSAYSPGRTTAAWRVVERLGTSMK